MVVNEMGVSRSFEEIVAEMEKDGEREREGQQSDSSPGDENNECRLQQEKKGQQSVTGCATLEANTNSSIFESDEYEEVIHEREMDYGYEDTSHG